LFDASFDVDTNGGIANFGGTTFTSELPLVTTIVKTQSNPDKYVAYAEYQSPVDFAQGQGGCVGPNFCATAIKRTEYIEVQRNGSSYTFPIDIARPPVILVHGINSNSSEWNVGSWRQSVSLAGSGQAVTGMGPFNTFAADYGTPVQGIQDFQPDYLAPSLLNGIVNSNLGFERNAGFVAAFIQQSIRDYAEAANNALGQPIAVVQADIVAHSMGGLVTRMIPKSGLQTFKNPGNYQKGTIHKMVTLGTPHLGTPNGRQVLMPVNFCVAQNLALLGNHTTFLRSALVNGASVHGGAFDLGDAVGGQYPSDVWSKLASIGEVPLWVAPLAAQAADSQYSLIDRSPLKGVFRNICFGALAFGGPDNMLTNYSATGWKVLLHGESDGVVPVNSAVAGMPLVIFDPVNNSPGTAVNAFPEVVHSTGVMTLWSPTAMVSGFTVGTELHTSGPVMQRVIELLNTPRTDFSAYVVFP
jgi:pimeloyl-ACP methyl ester carboxylesterase